MKTKEHNGRLGVSNVVAFTPRPPEFVGALLPLKGNQG